MHKINSFFTHKIIGSLAFSKALLKAPFSMGMICPSSPFLTNRLASQIPTEIIEKLKMELSDGNKEQEKHGYVIELGAGTGAVTRALLRRGVPPSRLLVFEHNDTMASLLTQRFPGIRIIQDDAANLAYHLPKNAYIASIVSSLPFVSLPMEVSNNIIDAIKCNLGDKMLIQYTYALNKKTLLEEQGFDIHKKSTVWLNLPPAKVHCYGFDTQK